MAVEFTMPKLGHLMEEGMVSRWLKGVGERVEKGDILLEVEMDKAVLEVESFVSGTLLQILVEEGETVPVGTPLALLGEPGEER
jgi:pyruvate dehydrogenase E2 component (dihydrolipoamide acetyltransferase)